MPGVPDRLSRNWPTRLPSGPGFIAASIWLVVYVACVVTGQRFSSDSLYTAWQLLPLDPLVAHPLRSVWYLHTQPPLWNLIIGTVGRWSPLSLGLSMQLVIAACGATLAGVVASIVRHLDVRRLPAVVIAVIATVNGEVLRLAFVPQYELPVALGLAVMAWAVVRPSSARVTLQWLVGVGTAIVLSRSLYHPVWLVAVIAGAAWRLRRDLDLRRTIATALVPLVLIGGWMAKNEIVFDRPTMSSWTGMNFLRSISPVVPLDEMEALTDDGSVGRVAVVNPFSALVEYAGALPACVHRHDDPVLTGVTKVEGGSRGTLFDVPNYNNECYLDAYDRAGSDARELIVARPGAWVSGRWFSLQIWFTKSDPVPSTSSVLSAIDVGTAVQRARIPATVGMQGWGRPYFGADGVPTRLQLTDIALAAALCWLVTVTALRRTRAQRSGRALVIFVGGTYAWTLIAGTFGELGEGGRFRVVLDPLIWSLVGAEVLRRLDHVRDRSI